MHAGLDLLTGPPLAVYQAADLMPCGLPPTPRCLSACSEQVKVEEIHLSMTVSFHTSRQHAVAGIGWVGWCASWWAWHLGGQQVHTIQPTHAPLHPVSTRAQVMMNGLNGRLYYPNEKLRLIPFINITRSGNKVGGRQ